MTTLTAAPNTLQASLIEALTSSGGQPERALEQAFHQLSRGGDLPLVLAMVKALVRIGVPGIAVRLLHTGGGALAAQPQIAALATQLENLPSGEIPHDELNARLAKHRDALLSNRPLLKALEPALRSVDPDLHVFRTTAGNLHVIRNGSNRRLEFVFPFADHIANAAAAAVPSVESDTSFQLLGVPSPPLWNRLLSLRHSGGYIPPIDLIEPDPEIFALWLAMIVDPEVWRDERVAVFVGPDAKQQYSAFITEHPWRLPAVHTITSHRPRWTPPNMDRQSQEAIANAITTRRKDAKAEIDRLYAGRDAKYWRDRFAEVSDGGEPLRIVGFTSRFSTVMRYSMRDLGSAFRRLGCRFESVMQPNDYAVSVNVADALRRHQPDMIVVINHLRREFTDSMPANVPYVCWIQDHMQGLWSRKSGGSVGEFDLVTGHGRDVMVSLYGYPPEQFIATSNLTALDVFSAKPIDPCELEPYRCDVSYVGHGSESPEQLVQEMSQGNEPLYRYFQAILHAVQRHLSANDAINTMELIEIVLDAERASGHAPLPPEVRRAVIVPAAQRIYDRVLRHQTLAWAADWARARNRTLRVYGRGWEKHPQFKPFACGEIEHGEPLRRLYLASAVCLQINGYASLHQRLLDGLASGACMLTRYNPSDFIRAPHAAIQRFIIERNVQSLEQLMSLAQREPALRQALNEAEQLVGTRLASKTDPIRTRHVEMHLACASMSPGEFTDAGLFNVLKYLISIPPRTAGDIDGFANSTFRTAADLHQRLDDLVANPATRKAMAAPMHQSVIANDTYEALAARIMRSFAFLQTRAS